MQENELKNWKLNFVNAMSTVVIAFVSFVGLILALTEFLQIREKFLSVEKITFIIIIISLFSSILIYKLKIWIENE